MAGNDFCQKRNQATQQTKDRWNVTHLSLFSGIGGIDLAGEQAGFKTIGFVERDPFCQKILAKNFPNVPIHNDVTTFDATPYKNKTTLLSAGFPCQPHSLSGKRKASDDERDLWHECVRIASETQPEWCIFENVAGLLTSESGRFFNRILSDLDNLRFDVGWYLYGANQVGAIHERKRLFIIAHTNVFRCQYVNEDTEWKQFRSRWQAQCWTERHDPNLHSTHVANTKIMQCNGSESQSTISGKSQTPEFGSGDCKGNLFTHLGTGNWKEWGINPVISEPKLCRNDDGFPQQLDRTRTRNSRLKALGNAVCPQQVYPLLHNIAVFEKEYALWKQQQQSTP
jgi:DNA (cytosine-5)-methyltransferase 1